MPSHPSLWPARAAFDSRRAWAFAGRCYRTARDTSRRYAGVTLRTLKRWTFQGLGPVEAALLNPVGRDRIHATATFALVFLFAVTSVDFLITGGPDFGAPARAAPQHLVRVAPPPSAVADESAPTALSSALEEAREANVVAVSQAFAATAEELSAERQAREGVIPRASEALVEGPSSGAASELSADAEEARPHKRSRVKGERAQEQAGN